MGTKKLVLAVLANAGDRTVAILGSVFAPAIIVLILLYLLIEMSRTYNSDKEVVLGLGACFCVMALFFLLLYPVVF